MITVEKTSVGQGPNSPGISRHWAPDRKRQITPSNCSRNLTG